MRTITQTPDYQPSGADNSYYSPSVPLSVYRDLAAELQATQAKLDTLVAKNHKLTQENQLLHQEISKAVNYVLQLQQLVNTSQQNSDCAERSARDDRAPHNHVATSPKHRPLNNSSWEQNQVPSSPAKAQSYTSHSSFIPTVVEMAVPPEPVFIEEQELSYYPIGEDKPMVGGWRLLLCVLLIVLTAFGAGYLIVRPLFQSHR
jgi:cobalamin biosynthesis Mg chelatase CobN